MPEVAARLISALHTSALQLYGSPNIFGAALGGASKNVIAIAAGVPMGAGPGENPRAVLITRGIVEIGRFATILGGRAETVTGLFGMGVAEGVASALHCSRARNRQALKCQPIRW